MPKIEQTTQTIDTSSEIKKIKKSSFFLKHFSSIMVLLVVLLALTSVYFYRKSQNDPNAVSQAEVKSLVSKVGRLMVLPENETPTIATVSDPEALKDQAFFVDAKKGDKVLIYSNAKKAILFDPSVNKIITIAPLNTDATKNPTVTPAPTPTEPKTDKKN